MPPILLERLETTAPYKAIRNGMNQRIVNFFHRHVFAGCENVRVTETACGSGYASHLIAQLPEVGLCIASDISPEYYLEAAIPGFSAEFILMDMFKPCLPEGSFDFVWNSSSVEELEDPQGAINAMADLVHPGGYVFVGVPHTWGPVSLLRLIPSKRYKTWLGVPFGYKRLKMMFKAAGLQVEQRIIYLGGIFIGVLGRRTA